MLQALLLLLAAPCVQEPAAAAPPAPDPARQAWDGLQQRLAAAQSLNLHARRELSDSAIPPEEMQEVKMEIQLQLARPGHGKAVWTSVFGSGDDAETIVIEWIGTA